MPDNDNNVMPFRPRPTAVQEEPPLRGEFVEPENPLELVSLVCDANDGELSIVLTPVPDGLAAWELRDADDVDRLAVHLIRLAQRMRGEGGPS